MSAMTVHAYLVYFNQFSNEPSLIFANHIDEVAKRNMEATKIEMLDCFIVPGQGDRLP